MSGTLRCVEHHQILVADRGGGRKIAQLNDVGLVNWGRKLSDLSQASVEVRGEACRKQAAKLAAIQARRHELVIFRDNERVWEGPITEVKNLNDRTVVRASDLMEYLNGTPITKWWPGVDDGGSAVMTTRFSAIINYELTTSYTRPLYPTGTRTFKRWEALDPPTDILPHLDVRAGTLETSGEALAFSMSVGEHLGTLAGQGLRFTVLGRQLIVWDSATTFGEIRPLAEKDLGERIALYATSLGFTSVQHVVGQPSNDPLDLEHVGTAGQVDEDYYGAWTTIDTFQEEDGDDPVAAVGAQANRLYDARKEMKLNLETPQGGQLRMSDTLQIGDLVPGTIVPVKAVLNRRPVSARYILSEVSVSEDENGETVGATFATESEIGI